MATSHNVSGMRSRCRGGGFTMCLDTTRTGDGDGDGILAILCLSLLYFIVCLSVPFFVLLRTGKKVSNYLLLEHSDSV